MANKNILVWTIALIVLASVALAIPDPDEVFTFTGGFTNSGDVAVTTMTNSGASADVDRFGNSAESYECNSADVDSISWSMGFDDDHSWTVSFWVKDDRASATWGGIFANIHQSGGQGWGLIMWETGTNFAFQRTSTSAVQFDGPTLGHWGQYVITYNHTSSVLSSYVNGTLGDSASWTWTDTFSSTPFCKWHTDSTYAMAVMHLDDFNYWNNTILSTEQITDLFGNESVDATRNYDYWGSGPSTTYFEINASDIYDGSHIQNFSALVNGTYYSTTNGTVTTTIAINASLVFDVSIINATDDGGYFNLSTEDVNLSENFEGDLWQSEIILGASELMTNHTLTGYFLINGTNASSINYLKAGSYNFSFVNASYYPMELIYNATALFNGSINVTDVYGTQLNITVLNAFTGLGLSNFSGWIANSDYNMNTTFNSSSDSTLMNLSFGNYSVFVDNEDYAISNSTNYEDIEVTLASEYLNFSLWSNNSIMIYIRDETTNNYITSNITVTIDGENSSVTNYTSTGQLFVQDLLDGNYSIKFSASNYTVKTYTVTVAARSTQTLNAYLSSEYEYVTLTVVDDLSGGTIEGITLQMSRQINSTWTVVENKLSDVTGRAQFSYIPNIKYRFYLSGTGYESKTFDLDPILYSSYAIRMDRNVTVSQPWDFAGISVNYYPTDFRNNETNNVTFFIASPDGSLESYGILIVYPGGSVNQSGNNSIGDEFTLEFNITGAVFGDTVDITFWYDTVFSDNKSFFNAYLVDGFNASEYTFVKNKDKTYGMGILERAGITVLAAGAVAGMAYFATGPIGALVFGIFVEGVAAYIGFIPLWLVLIPTLIAFMLILNRSSGV